LSYLALNLCSLQSAPFPYTTLFRSHPGDRVLARHCCLSPRSRVENGSQRPVYPFSRLFSPTAGAGLTRPTPAAQGVLLAQACPRSEEHTSELQSRENLVCRLLLENK